MRAEHLRVILLAATLLLLGGCVPESRTKYITSQSVRYDIDATYVIREFKLNDGTRCVASSGGGLNCDWKHSE